MGVTLNVCISDSKVCLDQSRQLATQPCRDETVVQPRDLRSSVTVSLVRPAAEVLPAALIAGGAVKAESSYQHNGDSLHLRTQFFVFNSMFSWKCML